MTEHQYEVVLLDDETMCKRSLMVKAEDFAEAEERAKDILVLNGEPYDKIIEIKKDY